VQPMEYICATMILRLQAGEPVGLVGDERPLVRGR
jgi:hypothetical protein